MIFDLMYWLLQYGIWVFLVVAIYWGYTRAKLKDVALATAKRYCEQRSVQLLDESVAWHSARFTRTPRGRLVRAHTYQFEFTVVGDRRYRGEVTITRKHLLDAQLESHLSGHSDGPGATLQH